MNRPGVPVRETAALKGQISSFFTEEGMIWYAGRVEGKGTFGYPVLEDGKIDVNHPDPRFTDKSFVKLIDPIDVGITKLKV